MMEEDFVSALLRNSEGPPEQRDRKVSRTYSVDFWGMELNFGHNPGY